MLNSCERNGHGSALLIISLMDAKKITSRELLITAETKSFRQKAQHFDRSFSQVVGLAYLTSPETPRPFKGHVKELRLVITSGLEGFKQEK